jgi:hypothetical protein
MAKDPDEMTAAQIEGRVIHLAFDGDRLRFKEFCAKLKSGLPQGTGVTLRGSVITNQRWENGGPFDEKGRGTSDLDVTLVGSEVMNYWDKNGFYIPALHTKPLCDEDPNIAPKLNPLREELQRIVGRPVNFQATTNLILFAREVLLDEPYFTLIEAAKEA